MFHKILVAIDRSSLSQHVFDEALSLAQATSANLILLNVLSLEDEESPSAPIVSGHEFYPGGLSRSVVEIYQELWDAYAERGLERLRSFTEQAQAAGVDVTFRLSLGSPGRIICELARELNTDLVVVGRHSHSWLNELILGSVSNYVLHHAPCSVLTIHHQHRSVADSATGKQAVMAFP